MTVLGVNVTMVAMFFFAILIESPHQFTSNRAINDVPPFGIIRCDEIHCFSASFRLVSALTKVRSDAVYDLTLVCCPSCPSWTLI